LHLCRQPYRVGDLLLLTSTSSESDEVQTLLLVENVERGEVKRDQQVIQALMQMAPKDNGILPSLALQAEAQTSQSHSESIKSLNRVCQKSYCLYRWDSGGPPDILLASHKLAVQTSGVLQHSPSAGPGTSSIEWGPVMPTFPTCN